MSSNKPLKIQTTWDRLPQDEKDRRKAYFASVREEKLLKSQRPPRKYRKRDFGWKILAGVTLNVESLGCYVRYAELDKKARIGFNNAETFLSPYVDVNLLKKTGSKQYLRSGYMSMMFDIDCNFSVAEWNELFPCLPLSHMTGRYLGNGIYERPHARIALEYPVFLEPQSHQSPEVQKRQKMDRVRFDRIEDFIVTKLRDAGVKIDKGQKTLTKNPDSDCWDSHVGCQGGRTLREIEDALGDEYKKLRSNRVNIHTGTSIAVNRFHFRKVDCKVPRTVPANINDVVYQESRNMTIFDHVRFIAYKFKVSNRYSGYHDVAEYLRPHVSRINRSFAVPLDRKELEYIISSISKYCVSPDFKMTDIKNRGAASDIILTQDNPKLRQKKGAIYTNYLRTLKSFQAVQKFKQENSDVSKEQAIKSLKLSRNTVLKYWDLESIKDVKACVRYEDTKEEASQIRSALLQSVGLVNSLPYSDVQHGVLRESGFTRKSATITGSMTHVSEICKDLSLEFDDERLEYDYLNHYVESYCENERPSTQIIAGDIEYYLEECG